MAGYQGLPEIRCTSLLSRRWRALVQQVLDDTSTPFRFEMTLNSAEVHRNQQAALRELFGAGARGQQVRGARLIAAKGSPGEHAAHRAHRENWPALTHVCSRCLMW